MQKLFGTDGVRGKAGIKLTAAVAMNLAMAAGIYFKKGAKTKKILVGKDTRRSGYMIENAIVSGLTAVGYDVVQIGPMPTPAVAFLTQDMRCDAGIMISASHNPYYDNGVKFFDSNGDKLQEKDETAIEKIFYDASQLENAQEIETKIGASKRIDDVIGRYIVHIKNSFPKDLTLSGLRVVVDTANGAAYKTAPTVLRELGAEVFVIGDTPDGFNINEGCGAMHPQTMAKAVKEYRADIGLALDGDADRLVVCDENGSKIDGDQLIGILAKYLHDEKILKNSGVVTTVMSNQALEDFLKAQKITLDRANVGDKYVLEVMKRDGFNFGGEESGHIIFSDYAKTGDGLVSALQVLAYLVKKKQRASVAFDLFEIYPSKLVNINIASKPAIDSIKGAKELIKEVEDAGLRPLIRYSGTENKMRILIEGRDIKKVERYMEQCVAFFKSKLD
ncbi:MAG: phosphoglucosamine mutase [Campylobacterota bacterium]